jgi:hypothetical protein
MWINLLKAGGYVCVLREIAGMLGNSQYEQELQRSRQLNMVLGITLGATLGISTGMLLALRSAKEFQDKEIL